MNVLRIAWRNLWRNRARTAITGAAIALNTAILIVTMGLTEGMLQTTLNNLTSMVLGQVQVHAPDYRAKRSLHKFIPQPEAILNAADQAGVGAAARSYGAGLASIASKSSGALFWGVDPARERQAFELVQQVQQGDFLSEQRPTTAGGDADELPPREVVLGHKLANALQAQIGSELVAVVQAADGSIGNDLFVVKGILKTVSSDIDRSAAIIHRQDFAELFVSGGRVHEVALRSRQSVDSAQIAALVSPAAPGMETLTWEALAPGPAQMVEMFAAVMLIFGLIFGMAAGTSVMNSMLMSTFDRIREFGVLKALGATPWRIIRDVACEAWVMALLFSILGAGLGMGANFYLHRHGLELGTGDDLLLSGVAFDPVWRSAISLEGVVSSVVLMWIVSVLASIYPALKAARLDPVVAMTEP